LELYPAIDRCDGIPSELYHYDPLHHRLVLLSERTSQLEQLLQSAAATVHASIPQILIILSARFLRMSLHYESIAYAAILKDVGVLYQTFYLVANAMGLAACALGVGNSDLFAETAGTDYYEETSVGEFIFRIAS
jgi:oxazoline/thiazoline dehydrogenase